MSDYRELEARGVPEDLWPDDAFQQKYTMDYMLSLATQRDVGSTKESKPKGEKVQLRLEFEQKFLLDTRQSAQILEELCVPPWGGPLPFAGFANPRRGNTVCQIRQYYDNAGRFRHTGETWGHKQWIALSKYVKEKKKSLFLNTPYSANSEEEEIISRDEFEHGWDKSTRRLQKIRIQVPSVCADHRTVIDFFYTNRDEGIVTYAVVAEDEAMLDDTTTGLVLEFDLPIYLRKYLICKVDSRDPEMKNFRSANMIDTSASIEAFERAISQLYGPT